MEPNEKNWIVLESGTKIDKEIISDLVSCAMTGAAYWARIEEYKKPEKFDFMTMTEPVSEDYPLNEGGAWVILDIETDKKYTLDLASIKSGLSKMETSKFVVVRRTWAEMTFDGSFDGNDGDLFLQMCLLGEVIYG